MCEGGGGGGVCAYHNEKKVPDEWQARQRTPARLQEEAASTTQRNLQQE